MGVVNITPDSFSDGGQFVEPSAAIDHALNLLSQGADLIDLGAESSRPGAHYIPIDLEWQRLEPVVTALVEQGYGGRVSVDTNKPAIMQRLADFGVAVINDIRRGADQETLKILASKGLRYIAMHLHNSPDTMQIQPLQGQQAVKKVLNFYQDTTELLLSCGFTSQDIWLDPGIGFGKDDKANLLLIEQSLAEAKRRPLILGISRKSFMGRLLQIPEPKDRDGPSKMLELSFLINGVKAIRTHDVKTLVKLRALIER